MDLIIVRENTEGFYSDRNMFVGPAEFMPDEDTAFSIRKITAKACSAVAQTAFELARDRRRKVTAVHKANVVKLSDGLFLREVRKVAEQFPDVQLEELIVDATAAALIRRPDSFDVIVTTNMFGDILSDEASELSGSLGLGGSISVGGGICVAQAQHGSAPDIAGHNVANPTSLIMSASMLLHWLGQRHDDARLLDAAQRIEVAVEQVLEVPASRTRDVGGTQDTDQFCASVIAALQSQPAGPADLGRQFPRPGPHSPLTHRKDAHGLHRRARDPHPVRDRGPDLARRAPSPTRTCCRTAWSPPSCGDTPRTACSAFPGTWNDYAAVR